MNVEAWKPWPGDPGYLVSNQGRVRGPSGKILKYGSGSNDRLQVSPYDPNTKKGKTREVHKMVLETFVGPCPLGHEARHRNGKHHDNRLENLVYGTRVENMADKVEHGHIPKGTGPSSRSLGTRENWFCVNVL
jgi:hypothetical protein